MRRTFIPLSLLVLILASTFAAAAQIETHKCHTSHDAITIKTDPGLAVFKPSIDKLHINRPVYHPGTDELKVYNPIYHPKTDKIEVNHLGGNKRPLVFL